MSQALGRPWDHEFEKWCKEEARGFEKVCEGMANEKRQKLVDAAKPSAMSTITRAMRTTIAEDFSRRARPFLDQQQRQWQKAKEQLGQTKEPYAWDDYDPHEIVVKERKSDDRENEGLEPRRNEIGSSNFAGIEERQNLLMIAMRGKLVCQHLPVIPLTLQRHT